MNRNSQSDRLSDEQIQALDEIGMFWDRKNDRNREKGYAEALKYRKIHGNLDVPTTYKTETGCRLGRWIADQRENKSLSEQRKKRLDDIGMIWTKPDSWELHYALAKAYYEEYGNLNVPPRYTANGVWLSKWLNE
jgi:hypothetical protein